MENYSIRELVEQVGRGQIRIPAFQRGFVWDAERVAYLMDSIYKGYPFGSLMFWRTKEQLKFDRNLGPFKLPEPKEDYPVDYVLDGQQRLTSIFGVFQNDLTKEDGEDWTDVYFDFSIEKTAQDSQFFALLPHDVQPDRHFPIRTLFDSVEYRTATKDLPTETIKLIDDMQAVFKETKIPVQISKTDDKATVAIIFERVNRQGVELDTLQLLSAWTWSEEFQLQDQFEEISDELGPFGFEEVGADTDLLLRCCSAILSGDASPQSLMNLNGAHVRSNFDRVVNGVKGAVDYVRRNYKVEVLKNLPYTTLIVPLSVFFASSGASEVRFNHSQKLIIDKWFWRSCFSRRYSSGVLRNLKTDIDNMSALRDGNPTDLGEFSAHVDEDFFKKNHFVMSNVNTKTFILMLAQHSPTSFISGSPVNLAKVLKNANRLEFHHMYPKDYLNRSNQKEISENILSNICFLSRADNRTLGGESPRLYRSKMPHEVDHILKSALSDEALFSENYQAFVDSRSKILKEAATKLCGSN